LIKDIKEISNQEIRNLIEGKEIDVIIGGPPCQGFSMAGNIGRSFVDDERNYLFREFLRFVEIIKPKMFVMENVSRMVSHNKGKTIQEIKRKFELIGYNVQVKILQASDYGVPQKRQRMIMVGDTGQFFKYPEGVKNEISVFE
ncbi:DNA (cytosine-5-)-methyltransferase, partial [Salmonella enterica subsp. enterica serovar Anatum]|nr:DNA (cytosine-5-)-methyltransferase [Salmonella enterica subsp. enterica serovar Anatum]